MVEHFQPYVGLMIVWRNRTQKGYMNIFVGKCCVTRWYAYNGNLIEARCVANGSWWELASLFMRYNHGINLKPRWWFAKHRWQMQQQYSMTNRARPPDVWAIEKCVIEAKLMGLGTFIFAFFVFILHSIRFNSLSGIIFIFLSILRLCWRRICFIYDRQRSKNEVSLWNWHNRDEWRM